MRADEQRAESTGRRSIQKVASAQSILSSILEPESVEEPEPIAFQASMETEPTETSFLDPSDFRTSPMTESVRVTDCAFTTESSEVSRRNMWREIQKGRLKGRRRPRLEKTDTVEELDPGKEINQGLHLRHIQKHWTSKEGQEQDVEKQGSIKKDKEMRGPISNHILSRVMTSSYASSSSPSSSFNNSSEESDEVFSEGEELAKRKNVRKVSNDDNRLT